MRGWSVVAGVVLLCAALGVGVWLVRAGDDEPARRERPAARASDVPTVTPGARLRSRPDPCARPARAGFEPTAIGVEGAGARIPVVGLPRDARGVPGVPPLTSGGKWEFAFDVEQGVEPGDRRGNVLLNAHTWPDGSALGNRLLDVLQRRDRIVVRGDDGARLCFRVSDEVEVDALDPFPRYFETSGPHQLAIIVCSGERLGPGEWTKRTIWFARAEA